MDENTVAAVDCGDGSHSFYRLDLRSLAATRRGAEGAHPAELRSLRLCRETVVRLHKAESAVARSPKRDSLLLDRVDMFIPALGPITALTSALEVGEVQRFSSIKKAISYCGLSSAG
jgi:transposase